MTTPSRRGNQCRKCVFCTRLLPSLKRTWNEFVIIIMGLHATRITNKRMLCSCWSSAKTKNGSTSLNCTNNIKRFYNARLHAIFKTNGTNDFMSLRTRIHTVCFSTTLHAIHCIRLFHVVAFMRWCGLFFLDTAHSIVVPSIYTSYFFCFYKTHFPSSLIFIRHCYRWCWT